MNFVRNIKETDKELFFGPLTEEDIFINIEPWWIMAHIMHHIGLFRSITQARKNGWDKPIPEGFTELTVGKRAKKQTLYILNIKEETS